MFSFLIFKLKGDRVGAKSFEKPTRKEAESLD